MPHVVISFNDGEILHADTPEVTFDLSVMEAELRSVDPNCERAILPTAAIRQVLVGDPEPAPPQNEVDTWDRAAFHFADGEVRRAWIAPEALLGRFGGVWRIVEPGSREIATVAIPYTSLKGVYRIRQWDSRSAAERDEGVRLEQLARVLTEREAGATPEDRQRRALLARMRRDEGGAAPSRP
ncbi:MAG: hypothetical protein JOZ92_09585 [Candidatus Dormibacteraeota bacterium]|nr:hypothetical protein [Candidatus Dormibacteraeota bacterium]